MVYVAAHHVSSLRNPSRQRKIEYFPSKEETRALTQLDRVPQAVLQAPSVPVMLIDF